jgi:hypothetical protein
LPRTGQKEAIMTRRALPRRMDVEGEEMVVLSVAEYEHLDASRRQVGARQARLRSLTQQMGELTDLLRLAQQAVTEARPALIRSRQPAILAAYAVDSPRYSTGGRPRILPDP